MTAPLRRFLLSLALLAASTGPGWAGQKQNPQTGKIDFCLSVREEDGSPAMNACQPLEVENGTLTDDGDGAFSYVAPAGGGGDSITVNTAAATNANFLDNLYLDFAIDTAATPDDITAKFNYAETLAGNPALLTTEVIFTADGLLAEGTTADAIEIKLAFPDPVTTDKTITLFNATDTVVGRDTTDTLTNKTLNLGSNTLTATSAQLATALSDETGSGLLAFATAPTFLTSLSINAGGFLDLDDQGELRFYETDANGENYLAFKAPAAVTTTSTCTLENDGNPIPDSCVGDGTDAGGTDTNSLILSYGGRSSQSADFYGIPYAYQIPLGTNAQANAFEMPVSCVAADIRARVETAPGAGESWVVHIREDSACNGTMASQLSCTISGTGTSCSGTGSATLDVGNCVQFFWDETSVSAATLQNSVTLECNAITT